MKYVILEKAKPYSRTRRGKFERVRGYGQLIFPFAKPKATLKELEIGEMTKEERKQYLAPWGGRHERKADIIASEPSVNMKKLKHNPSFALYILEHPESHPAEVVEAAAKTIGEEALKVKQEVERTVKISR